MRAAAAADRIRDTMHRMETPQIALAPVHDTAAAAPQDLTALCLSGGGYRAMIFHLGCLWRLNDAGMLGKLDRVSSVSGGSITAGVLGMNWASLGLGKTTPSASKEAFEQYLVQPLRAMASTTVDAGAIFGGIFLPGTIADHVADRYDEILFHGKTLQDLPHDSAGPRFVINATNVQSGVLMRFSRPYMRDYRVGQALEPRLPLARAVAASSAFPPILSPCEIDLAKYGLTLTPGNEPGDMPEDLAMPPYTTKLVLSDGGVYDNLGLETAWKKCKNLLVSDGGGHYKPEPEPHHDWARHAYRVLDLIDSQVRALRTRDLIYLFEQKVRNGAYWSTRQDLAKTYGAAAALPCDFKRSTELAMVETRLAKMDPGIQERLVNWGYAVSDASIRAFVNKDLPRPSGFPYPNAGV